MARGRHPHSYAVAGAQAVIRALQNGAQFGTPKASPSYQVLYQTQAGNIIAESSREDGRATFVRVGIVRPGGDEMLEQSEPWATLEATEAARLIACGAFQRIN